MPKKRRFTSKEIALLKALETRRVPYLVVGLAAASLQGAPVVTQDIDLWIEDLTDPRFHEALEAVRAFYVPPWGHNAPLIGGDGLELIDLVTSMHGLRGFKAEYRQAKKVKLGTLTLRLLPLARIIRSKRALGRPKDRAVLPILEGVLQVKKTKRL